MSHEVVNDQVLVIYVIDDIINYMVNILENVTKSCVVRYQ